MEKSFSPSTVTAGDASTLTFLISNPNPLGTTPFTNVSFQDALPLGIVSAVAGPNACPDAIYVINTDPNTGVVTITAQGITLAAQDFCMQTFQVTTSPTASGDLFNTTSAISADGGFAGPAASATLTVQSVTPALVAPTIAKMFAPNEAAPGGVVTLTFTLSNVNPIGTPPLTNVSFSDTLPAQTTIVPNSVTTTCGGGAIPQVTATSIAITGVTLAAGASCTVTATVQVSALAVPNAVLSNTTSAVTGTDPGGVVLVGNQATAFLTVRAVPPPATPPTAPLVAKTFVPSAIDVDRSTSTDRRS